MQFDLNEHPHRRQNLLTGDWVLVSPHRSKRPWQGAIGASPQRPLSFDETCYLCPGNKRANGAVNPEYGGTFVFGNDFPALQSDTPADVQLDALLPIAPARGESRVICFSPDHSRTLPALDVTQVREVVESWCEQSELLFRDYSYVQVFENKGEMMGCSNPHPHGQIWASDYVPTELDVENRRQSEWHREHGTSLLQDVLIREDREAARIVESNSHWLAVVPWWASWPFETLVIARDPVARLPELGNSARDELATLLHRLTARYDNLFETSFPYSMGWHQAPMSDGVEPHAWRLHAHFYPPLLRSASVRKFMVGYELLAEAQRDLTPEQAAERLRETSPVLRRTQR